MSKYILAFAGGMGSGKSELTKELSARLNWPRVSFGDHVRELAREAGRDEHDRSELQKLGQALVLTQPEKFVDDVIAAAGQNAPYIILDGVRHVEILLTLKRKFPNFRLIYIKTPTEVRQSRVVERDDVERRLVASYDADITEAQISRIIPQYAHKTVDGTLPVSFLVNELEAYARQETNRTEDAA